MLCTGIYGLLILVVTS